MVMKKKNKTSITAEQLEAIMERDLIAKYKEILRSQKPRVKKWQREYKRLYMKDYRQLPKQKMWRKAYMKKYNQLPKMKEKMRKIQGSPKYKEIQRLRYKVKSLERKIELVELGI